MGWGHNACSCGSHLINRRWSQEILREASLTPISLPLNISFCEIINLSCPFYGHFGLGLLLLAAKSIPPGTEPYTIFRARALVMDWLKWESKLLLVKQKRGQVVNLEREPMIDPTLLKFVIQLTLQDCWFRNTSSSLITNKHYLFLASMKNVSEYSWLVIASTAS